MKPTHVFKSCLWTSVLSASHALTFIAGETSSVLQGDEAVAKKIFPAQKHRRLVTQQLQERGSYASCSQDVELVNHCFGGSQGECQGTVNAYVYGSNDGLLTFVSPDSQFYVPHEVGAIDQSRIAIPIPQGQSVNVHIPGCLVGGRMSFVSGGDQLHYAGTVAGAQGGFVQPSETNPDDSNANSYWSFMEFTSTEVGGLTVNPSSVDFAGIPIAMMLEDCNAGSKPLFTGGMKADAVATICQNLTEQAKVDGFPWDQLCTRSQDGGSFVRALSPNALTKGNDETAFKHYWKSYVDQVWNEYRSQDLVFDVAAEGTHICRVGGDDQLHCANDSVLISKPHTSDIFSCSSGPFEHTGNLVRDGITARLCAAFVRSTIHTGHAQPCDLLGPDQYYQTNPTNYFAKYAHEASKRGTGYAFAFDWVNPPSAPPSEFQHGQWTVRSPGKLTITVGGWR